MDINITVSCRDANHIKEIKKGMRNFIRKMKHSSEEKVDYTIVLINLEKGESHTIVNKEKRTALEVTVQEQPLSNDLVDAIGEKIAVKIASTLNNC